MPSLISSDDRAQVTAALARTQVVADVYADGTWNGRNDNESLETLRLDGAVLLSDRWQTGLTIPVVRRERFADHQTGLGDLAGTIAFEALPDWDYKPWRPKGLVFAQIIAPTGRPIQESSTALQLDARGRGFWAASVGTLMTKIFGSVDTFASLSVHRSISRSYANETSSGSLHPGWGGLLSVGSGYNWDAVRLGGALAWSYEDAVEVRGTQSSPGAVERFGTLTLNASYLVEEAWAITASYSDQLAVGNPTNTRLGRTLMLQIQRRWSR